MPNSIKHVQTSIPEADLALLRLPQVVDITGLDKQRIYTMAREGSFPKQVKISERSVAWVKSEVEAWIRDAIAKRGE